MALLRQCLYVLRVKRQELQPGDTFELDDLRWWGQADPWAALLRDPQLIEFRAPGGRPFEAVTELS